MSQLSLFDYINGITIGSIAAEMSFSPLEDAWKFAISMGFYGVFAVLFSLLSNKSIAFRRVFVGKSLMLMDNGKIYLKNLKKSKLDLNEFLEQCRIGGYYNPDELQTVIMESNGQLSFLPKSESRPASPKDLGIQPEAERIPSVVISDGKILHGNLRLAGKNETWLRETLKAEKYPPISKIFLALCDSNNKLYVFEYNNENRSNDVSI